MLILGHRGDRQRFPDNSVEGIKSAFKLGADGVEFDVYYKPDKGIYLTHPYLHDLNTQYPKLEDVFSEFANSGLLQIEINFLETEGLPILKGLIEKYNVGDYVLASSVFPLLRYIKEVFPDSKINLLATRLIEEWWTEDFGNYFLLNYLKLTGANGLDTGYKGFWTKERVDYFYNLGFHTAGHLYSDTQEEFEVLSSTGLDTCTADKLDVLKCRNK